MTAPARSLWVSKAISRQRLRSEPCRVAHPFLQADSILEWGFLLFFASTLGFFFELLHVKLLLLDPSSQQLHREDQQQVLGRESANVLLKLQQKPGKLGRCRTTRLDLIEHESHEDFIT